MRTKRNETRTLHSLPFNIMDNVYPHKQLKLHLFSILFKYINPVFQYLESLPFLHRARVQQANSLQIAMFSVSTNLTIFFSNTAGCRTRNNFFSWSYGKKKSTNKNSLILMQTNDKPFPKQALDFTCLSFKSFENTVRKGEIARNEQFLLFPQCFLPIWRTFYHFHRI